MDGRQRLMAWAWASVASSPSPSVSWAATASASFVSVREEVIDYYVNQDLYDQAAKEYNVTVEQADIDAALDETKAMFESDAERNRSHALQSRALERGKFHVSSTFHDIASALLPAQAHRARSRSLREP